MVNTPLQFPASPQFILIGLKPHTLARLYQLQYKNKQQYDNYYCSYRKINALVALFEFML